MLATRSQSYTSLLKFSVIARYCFLSNIRMPALHKDSLLPDQVDVDSERSGLQMFRDPSPKFAKTIAVKCDDAKIIRRRGDAAKHPAFWLKKTMTESRATL